MRMFTLITLALVMLTMACPVVPSDAAPAPSAAEFPLLCQSYGWFAAEMARWRDTGVPLAKAQASMHEWDTAHAFSADIQRIHREVIALVYADSTRPGWAWETIVRTACESWQAGRASFPDNIRRSAIPTALPPAHPSSTAKIESDIASWNPRSSTPLKRGDSMSISQSDRDSLKKWADKYPMRLGTDKGVRPEEQLPSENFFELPYISGFTNLSSMPCSDLGCWGSYE